MKVTIVRPDNTIIVDGVARTVDCSVLPSAHRVIQWLGESGWIEFEQTPGTDHLANMPLASFEAYQEFVDAWEDAGLPPVPTLPEAIAAKDAAIEAEFKARAAATILHTVGGVEHPWHADGEAVTNIMGVVVMINSGVPVPNPRPWTPVGSHTSVDITHAELIGLGAAIAARKDILHAAKKAKQAAVAALTTIEDVAAYDAAAGWP